MRGFLRCKKGHEDDIVSFIVNAVEEGSSGLEIAQLIFALEDAGILPNARNNSKLSAYYNAIAFAAGIRLVSLRQVSKKYSELSDEREKMIGCEGRHTVSAKFAKSFRQAGRMTAELEEQDGIKSGSESIPDSSSRFQ